METRTLYQITVEDLDIRGCYESSFWVEFPNDYYSTIERARPFLKSVVEEYLIYFRCTIKSGNTRNDTEVVVQDLYGHEATIRIDEVLVIIDPPMSEDSKNRKTLTSIDIDRMTGLLE